MNAVQGAVELCNWMSEHGTDAVLLNISSAVYDSPTENQIYEMKAQLPDCSPTPAPAPNKLPPARSRAASMVRRIAACERRHDLWHGIHYGTYAACLEGDRVACLIYCPWSLSFA